MSDVKQEPVIARPSIRNPAFQDIYSNNIRIGLSPSDFAITFSRLAEQSLGVTIIEDQAVVRMSTQQFKYFVDSAATMLSAWEDVFGAIPQTTKPQSIDQVRERIRKFKESLDKRGV
jgi:hypothetical protein